MRVTTKIDISVIVSTYNRTSALARVLAGLVAQIRPADEIIVADDGSTESTRACIEEMQRRAGIKMTHVWQPDEGFRLAKIRNAALRICKGDYVIFLDGDCIPDPHFIADHERLAGEGYFVQGKRILVDQAWSDHFTHQTVAGHRARLLFSRHLGNRHHLLRIGWLPPLTNTRLSGTRFCNVAIFKKDLFSVNGFNQAFQGWGREDSEMVVRLYKYGLTRKEHPFAAVCYHLWHPENDRTQLAVNDRLLAQAQAAGTYLCTDGIEPLDRQS